VVFGTLRTPPTGSLQANVAQGGSIRPLLPTDLPTQALAIAQEVDKAFSHVRHRIYSIDLGRDITDRWYIFELNPQPGLTSPGRGPETSVLYRAIADALVEAAEGSTLPRTVHPS
jgi:glutathione synthase/RimK-type ligase-like ATP-grasp enzyme